MSEMGCRLSQSKATFRVCRRYFRFTPGLGQSLMQLADGLTVLATRNPAGPP
jgi:hypothetical protein